MGDSPELHVRFDNVRIAVRSDSEQLRGPLKQYLSHHVAPEGPADAEIDLNLKKTFSPIPTHAGLILRYFGLKGFFHEGVTYFTDFRSYLTLDPGGKKAIGSISPETISESGVHFITHIFFTFALFEMLRHQGMFFLHSAAVVSPEGKSFVFPASSGQGKSTLALYLIREGYRYLSDDTIFLCRASGKVRISGFEKASHLPEGIFARFPELEPFADAPPLKNMGKKILDLERVYPNARLGQSTEPGVIIFLNKVGSGGSRLRPMDRLEAFDLLATQSPFAYINPKLAREHLNILRDFIAGSRIWILDSAADWMQDPSILKNTLQSALDGGGKL